MSTFAIDASVAIKWVVEESGTKEALSLRRHRLLAPDLLMAGAYLSLADIQGLRSRRFAT